MLHKICRTRPNLGQLPPLNHLLRWTHNPIAYQLTWSTLNWHSFLKTKKKKLHLHIIRSRVLSIVLYGSLWVVFLTWEKAKWQGLHDVFRWFRKPVTCPVTQWNHADTKGATLLSVTYSQKCIQSQLLRHEHFQIDFPCNIFIDKVCL